MMAMGIKEMLKISREKNPELLNKPASVNFLGLLPKTVGFLETILRDFQKEHATDRKIECLLPDNLDFLIKYNFITMDYFEIKNKIYGITYPGDEELIKSLNI